jgi:hypothetical protein
MTEHYAKFVGSLTVEDVRRRTVAHFYGWRGAGTPTVGDRLVAIPSDPVTVVDGIPMSGGDHSQGMSRRITSVSEARLLEILTDEELAKLGRDIDSYLEVWDKLHPDALAKTNPTILRVETEPNGPIVHIPQSFVEMVVDMLSREATREIFLGMYEDLSNGKLVGLTKKQRKWVHESFIGHRLDKAPVALKKIKVRGRVDKPLDFGPLPKKPPGMG